MKKYTKKTIKYYDNIASAYIKSDAAVVLKDKIDRFIGLLPGKRILDVACGPGHDIGYLARRGFDCLGIDLSERMIELARQNFKGKFEIMDFFDLKFGKDTFDGLWCSGVFVHTKKADLSKLLGNFRKILKHNGILGIITAQKRKRIKKPSDTRTYIMYDQEEFKNYLKKANYEILHSEIFRYGGRNRIFIIAKKIN